jgi:hypothetical protein
MSASRLVEENPDVRECRRRRLSNERVHPAESAINAILDLLLASPRSV